MAKTKFTLIGFEKVKNDWKAWASSPNRALPDFLNLIESSSLSLLRANTPKDTGKLASSWKTLERTTHSLEIGVPDDQEDKLHFVVNGTRFISPNPFMELIDNTINQLISTGLTQSLGKSHRYWRPIVNEGGGNFSNTVGLTGTKYNIRRSRGNASQLHKTFNKPSFSKRLGRRRRTSFNVGQLVKDLKLG